MLLKIKNKDTLIIDDFEFRCCIGRNGIKKGKQEGDGCTPKGTFKIGSIYWRRDRVPKLNCKLKSKVITKNMGWCNDKDSKLYNKQINLNNKINSEKLFRKDHKYNYFIEILYNREKIVKNKGSAIFLHLTKNYRPTAGCIAIKQKDFVIICKLINKNSKILIS